MKDYLTPIRRPESSSAETVTIDVENSSKERKSPLSEAQKALDDQLERISRIGARMQAAVEKQRNTVLDVKNGIVELREATQAAQYASKNWKTVSAELEKTPKEAGTSIALCERCMQGNASIPPLNATPGKEIISQTPDTRKRGRSTASPEPSKEERQSKKSNKGLAPKRLDTLEDFQANIAPSTSNAETGKPPEEWTRVERRSKGGRKSKNKNASSEPQKKGKGAKPKENASSDEKKNSSDKGRQSWKRRKKKLRPKPEAIIVKPGEGKSYTEILSKIRNDLKMPEKAEAEISSIRQTGSGCVMIELTRETKDKKELTAALEKAVDTLGTVKGVVRSMTLEIRDMDCLTTEEETRTAILRDLKEKSNDELKIHLSKPNKREQKMATITLPEKGAIKLLNNAKIKIGMVSCRVRKKVTVTRCFKCLGYGHLAKDCKGPDRSKLCYKCGKTEHRAAECKEELKCMLCEQMGEKPEKIRHALGSNVCEAYRRALAATKK